MKTRGIVLQGLDFGKGRDAEHGAPLKKFYSGRGLAVGDFDNDGDSDLLLINIGEPPALLRNDGGNGNHWLGIALTGTTSNRDGIGAKITMRAGARTFVDEVRSGSSYDSNSDTRVHFGLGTAAKIDSVQVRWPSGLVENFDNLAVDSIHTLREASGSS